MRLYRRPTLAVWAERYADLRRHELAPESLRLHQTVLRLLAEPLGDRRINRITREDAERWRASLYQRGLRVHTISTYITVARVVFGMAVRMGLLDSNPFGALPRPRPPVRRRLPELTEGEVLRLVRAAESPAWACLIALCALAGLRRGEAARLLWGDVQADRLTVRHDGEETSKRRERAVRLEPSLARVLDLYRPEPAEPERPVVWPAIPRGSLHTGMLRAIRAAGLEPWPRLFHSLRAWRATTWRQHYPEWAVDRMLGHSLAVARQHYLPDLPGGCFGPAVLPDSIGNLEEFCPQSSKRA